MAEDLLTLGDCESASYGLAYHSPAAFVRALVLNDRPSEQISDTYELLL